MTFNNAILNIEPSKSVSLLAKTKELQKTDPDIINLTAGEPDFDMPKAVVEEISKQMQNGYTHYTDSKGNLDLRERIAKKLLEENGAPYTADQIMITPGAKFAVYAVVRTLINDGDEAIWFSPGWVSYPSIVEVSGGKPVCVHLKYDEDYRINADELEAATNEKTKLLIINYPNNPTGKILTESDIEVLHTYMLRHPDIYLISDEIYENIIYDGNKTVSMASFADIFDRVIIINGFSKCSAMTGARVGYFACNSKLYKSILKLFQHTISCVSGFIQKGALVACDCKDDTEHMRQEFEKRKNLLVDGINKIPGVEFAEPVGAFYAWVKFDLDMTAEELADKLLTEAKIAGVPGDAYGEEEKLCVRFSYAASEDKLKAMLVNLEKFMKENYRG